MKGEFAPLFDEVETWARKYTNIPDQEKDSGLPSRLINHIKSNTNSDLAPKLLALSSTRYLAVARVINYTIMHNTFKPALIKGFGGQELPSLVLLFASNMRNSRDERPWIRLE